MNQEAPKKGGPLRAYLNFNVLYKILIGLVVGAVAGIILALNNITAIPEWISMFGTIFTRLLKMIIIPMIVGCVSTVWFLWGGIRDGIQLFKDLDKRVVDASDNGMGWHK